MLQWIYLFNFHFIYSLWSIILSYPYCYFLLDNLEMSETKTNSNWFFPHEQNQNQNEHHIRNEIKTKTNYMCFITNQKRFHHQLCTIQYVERCTTWFIIIYQLRVGEKNKTETKLKLISLFFKTCKINCTLWIVIDINFTNEIQIKPFTR